MTEIYVDGDGCPVKEDIYRVAKRYTLKVYLVCNSAMRVPKGSDIEPVVVGSHFDAVDDWIAEHVKKDDIVVTNDILLAARCLKLEARVINPRGHIYDEDNIGDALATRELFSDLRASGAMNLGPKAMGQKHKSNFLRELDTLIHAARLGKR